MSYFRLPQVYYVSSHTTGLTAGSTVTLSRSFDHDGYITGLDWGMCASSAVPYAVEHWPGRTNIEAQLRYAEGDNVHTAPVIGSVFGGTGSFPMRFKRPLMVRRNETLEVVLTNISAEDFDYTIDVMFDFSPQDLPNRREQARTQILAFNFRNLVVNNQQTNTVIVRRPGALYSLVYDTDEEKYPLELLSVSIEVIGKGFLVNQNSCLSCVAGLLEHSWFPDAVKVEAGDIISVTLNNILDTNPLQEDTTLERASIGIQYVPEGV